jgi:hypothetical protein
VLRRVPSSAVTSPWESDSMKFMMTAFSRSSSLTEPDPDPALSAFLFFSFSFFAFFSCFSFSYCTPHATVKSRNKTSQKTKDHKS